MQGEGALTGRPAVFCRFAGCNLWSGRAEDRSDAVCTFCDTDFVGMNGTDGGRYLDAAALARDLLDHHYLNDVEGLDQPTLEAISRWIFERLSRETPLLHRVTVRRGGCGEGCTFERSQI